MKQKKHTNKNGKTKHDKLGRPVNRREFLKKSSAIAAGAALGTVGFPYVVRSETKKFLKPIVAGLNAKPGDPTYISLE